MLIENKEKIKHYPEQLPDKYLTEVIEYLHFSKFKNKNEIAGRSSMLLSDQDEVWKNL